MHAVKRVVCLPTWQLNQAALATVQDALVRELADNFTSRLLNPFAASPWAPLAPWRVAALAHRLPEVFDAAAVYRLNATSQTYEPAAAADSAGGGSGNNSTAAGQSVQLATSCPAYKRVQGAWQQAQAKVSACQSAWSNITYVYTRKYVRNQEGYFAPDLRTSPFFNYTGILGSVNMPYRRAVDNCTSVVSYYGCTPMMRSDRHSSMH